MDESTRTLSARIRRFLTKPAREKIESVRYHLRALFPKRSETIRLPFGGTWALEESALDGQLRSGEFEVAETKFIMRFLRDGMTVLDVGAHHGFYTLLASKLVGPTGKVVAFEPSPRECKRLRQHVKLNRCKNVTIQGYALGHSDGDGVLFLVEGDMDYCNSLRPPAVNAATRKIRVSVSSLDASVNQAGIGRIDFIKIDTEGGELDVLRGAKSSLSERHRPVLLVEIAEIRTAAWGYSARETIRFLENQKYTWFSIRYDGSLVSLAEDHDIRDTNLVAVPNEQCNELQHLIGGSC